MWSGVRARRTRPPIRALGVPKLCCTTLPKNMTKKACRSRRKTSHHCGEQKRMAKKQKRRRPRSEDKRDISFFFVCTYPLFYSEIGLVLLFLDMMKPKISRGLPPPNLLFHLERYHSVFVNVGKNVLYGKERASFALRYAQIMLKLIFRNVLATQAFAG